MNKKLTIILGVTLIGIFWVASCGLPAAGPEMDGFSRSTEKLIKRGKYLVTVMGCNDCHSTKIMGPLGPMIDSTRLLSGFRADAPLPEFPTDPGSRQFVIANGEFTAYAGPWGISYAPNLTPDWSGIGEWTEEQFRVALTQGKAKGLQLGRPLMPPMPWQNFRDMEREDVRAMFAYLRSIPPVRNVVPTSGPSPAATGMDANKKRAKN